MSVNPSREAAAPAVPVSAPFARSATRRAAASAAALALGLVTVAAAGCTALTAGPTQTKDQDQTYRHAVSRVEFAVGSGKVSLSPGESGVVVVHRTLKFDQSEPTVSEVWSGDTLQVTASCPSGEDCSVDYTVQVPPGVSVQMNDNAGDISLNGLTGSVDVTLGTGNVDLSGLSGPVKVASTTGAITGDALWSTDVALTGITGDVSVAFASTPNSVQAVTTTGRVHVAVPQGATGYRVQAKATTGQVTVNVPQQTSSSHSIVATATTGDVQVD